MHDLLVGSQLKAKQAHQEQTSIVVKLGLEGIAVEELVLAGEGEALELEAVEDVERKEHDKFLKVQASENLTVEDTVNGNCSRSHDAQIDKETLKTLVIRLSHELDQHAVVQQAVSLLSLAVLDIGPVLVIAVDVGETVCVRLLIQHLHQGIVEGWRVVVVVYQERGERSGVGRHESGAGGKRSSR